MANPLKPIQLGTLQPQNPYINPGTLPQLPGMTRGATDLIQSELGGMPSPSETRTANAAWGVQAGLPPSQGLDFLGQRGSRLYRSEIDNRRRQGLQDLISFLRGYSGTVSATPGQLLNYGQRQQEKSFEDAMALWQQQMEQRRIDEQNQQELPYSYNIQSSSGGYPGGYGGYSFSRDRSGRLIQR